jgi:hypothetical protein
MGGCAHSSQDRPRGKYEYHVPEWEGKSRQKPSDVVWLKCKENVMDVCSKTERSKEKSLFVNMQKQGNCEE